MSVISVREIWSGRDGDDDGKIRRYSRHFRVVTNDQYDTAAVVIGSVGIQRGDVFPDDFGAWCQTANARNESFSPKIWLVTFNYSSEREIQPNPLNDPAKITWSGEPFQRPLIVDRNGDGVVNSAGDPFDPPIMRDDNRPVAHVTKNVASVPVWVLNYRDVVNSDAFTLDGLAVAAGKAKIKWINVGDWQERNNIRYRTLTFDVHLNKDGWNFQPLDMGYREIDPGDATKRITIKDNEGKQVTQPYLLDGSGAQLSDPSPTTAVFLDFEGYEELPFSVLPMS